MDKETLAKRVQSINPEVAEMIRSDKSTVEDVETPFFSNGSIHRVIYAGPYRPITFVFGLAGENYVTSLPKDSGHFFELSSRAGLHLDSNPLRIRYAEVFLESTRDFQSRFQIIRRFSDIELINKPTDEESQSYRDFEAKYENVIKPPEITGETPWHIKIFALKRQDLVLLDLTLSRDGSIETREALLQTDLPIAYVK